MGYSIIIQQFLNKTGTLTECEVYLSICLGYISISKWDDARHFLKCGNELADEYKYDVIIDKLYSIIEKRDTTEAKFLISCIPTKVINN